MEKYKKLPYDKVYILHLVENKDREDHMMHMIHHAGLENEIEIWWTCKRPYVNEIGDLMTSLHSKYYDMMRRRHRGVYGAVFNCALEHYTIVKTAYLRGYESVLILEDDITFMTTGRYALEHPPKEWDILKFFNATSKSSGKQLYKYEPDLWMEIDPHEANSSSACYALNRRAMKHWIDLFDQRFTYADGLFNQFINDGFLCYETRYKVCGIHAGLKSDISPFINKTINDSNIDTSSNFKKTEEASF